MNILLIGHEGYLGRGLHSYLARRHNVLGWDKKEDLFTLDPALLRAEKIDVLINLSVAADRQGGKTFEIDTLSEQVNVMGARHIATLLKGTEIIWIQMSTREVFGPVYGPDDVIKSDGDFQLKKFVREDQPFAPVNPYGKSKLMAEFISETHPFSNVIRLTSCYTDFDHTTRGWVLALLHAVTKGEVKLTQGGRQLRDPLHVDDLGRLMELICEKRIFGQIFNAGGGERNLISLREFVQIARPGISIEEAPGGDFGFAFDITKARELAGWEPQILIRERIPVIAKNVDLGFTGAVS